MGNHCCPCCDDGNGSTVASYYDIVGEGDEDDVDTLNVCAGEVELCDIDVQQDGDVEDEEDDEKNEHKEDDDDDDRSVEDVDYYTYYRVIPLITSTNETSTTTLRSEYKQRVRLEHGINSLGNTRGPPNSLQMRPKRVLIYEYEDLKHRYYREEESVNAEALLTSARRCLETERKKELYRDAIMRQNDVEQKKKIKEEYNEFFRGLSSTT
jgi:hypothetical protein